MLNRTADQYCPFTQRKMPYRWSSAWNRRCVTRWMARSAFVVLLGFIGHHASGADIHYLYDVNGQLHHVLDGTGVGMAYTYDAAGNLASIVPTDSVSVLDFSPRSGPVGTTVRIVGTGFSATVGQNSVAFNGFSAPTTEATVSTMVTTVPANATTGPISIHTTAGSATSALPFTVTDHGTEPNNTGHNAPAITSFTPNIGDAGTQVTLSGTGFQTAIIDESVKFHGFLSSIDTTNPTTIIARVPSGTNSGKISVATPYGLALSSADFFIPPNPYTAADLSAAGRIVPNGPSQTVSITTANKNGMLIFDGTAGQKLRISIGGASYSPASGSASFRIYNPDGTELKSIDVSINTGFLDAVTLPMTGTYTLVIDPAGTTTVTLDISILIFNDVSGNISANGPAVTPVITIPGQNARYAFSGMVGQKISVIISGASLSPGGYVYLRLLKPDGSELTSISISGSTGFLDATVLPVTGTYTLMADPVGAATASA